MIEIVKIGKTKGPEAEKLFKETVQEISEVLKRRVDEAKKLAKSDK